MVVEVVVVVANDDNEEHVVKDRGGGDGNNEEEEEEEDWRRRWRGMGTGGQGIEGEYGDYGHGLWSDYGTCRHVQKTPLHFNQLLTVNFSRDHSVVK